MNAFIPLVEVFGHSICYKCQNISRYDVQTYDILGDNIFQDKKLEYI